MNDALSVSGERLVVASKIMLVLREFNEATQTYATTLEDIFDIFLLVSAIQSTVDPASSDPASSAAVHAFVTSLLLEYRRSDTLLEIPEINGLLQFLNQFRLRTDELFVNIVTDTLAFDNGTVDLKTTIDNLDTRLTQDEAELHSMASAMAGMDFMEDQSSIDTWLATHVKDWVLDFALKQSKLLQIFETSNLWAISWMVPNHYLVSLTSTDRGYQPDQTWAGYCTLSLIHLLRGRRRLRCRSLSAPSNS